jgi:HlyD family secretion protein
VVAVDNQDLKLRPGMTANARFITAERKGVLKIPNAAARFRPPVGVTVRGDTNALAASAAAVPVALMESGPFAGLPVMPWQTGGERRRPTEEERASYVASLTPEQKQKYEQAMSELRARFAQGGGGGGGGFGGAGGGEGGGSGGERRRVAWGSPKTATVYLLEKEALSGGGEQEVLRAVTVRLGIADSTSVEVLEGLEEGNVVVSGITPATAVASTATRSLLGGPFGGPPRR